MDFSIIPFIYTLSLLKITLLPPFQAVTCSSDKHRKRFADNVTQ